MPLSANAHIDFGYPWWLSYGHLPIMAGAVALLLVGLARKWSRWSMLLLCLVALWSSAAFLVQRFVLNINGVPELPTQSYLRSGAGRVLDMGARIGRSSIMVLAARPQATLVAVDLFGRSFEQHFGRARIRSRDCLPTSERPGWANASQSRPRTFASFH